jgi:hypothetical protein
MQDRPLRFIAFVSLVLISVLPSVAAAWRDPVTFKAATFNPAKHPVLTLNDTRAPGISPDANERVLAGLESIAGLPEPQAIVLLGTALLVASGIARRRVTRNGRRPKD